MPQTRRLAAILAADVVGYSRLMGEDEAGTAKAVREHREAATPIFREFGGRLVKTTGDGVLLEFPSVVAAVECAIALQKQMVERNAGVPEEKRILYRMGVNLGDVLIEGDDILGDGVNIASRLESIAGPGGVCISGSAYEQVRGRVNADFIDLGNRKLKNIAEPIHAYAISVGKPAQAKPVKPAKAAKRSMVVPLVASIAALIVIVAFGVWYFRAGEKQTVAANAPTHLSIVVLPFTNLSGDPSQDYFADGITENLTTDLSHIRNSFVIARNTAFTFKGKNIAVKEISKELGVRYVLEGSVQRDQNRVRVNAQLVDGETGAHLWADRFEEDFADLFKLQDQVVARIANSLRVELVNAESRRPPPQSLDAVDLTMRGWALLWQKPTPQKDRMARELFEQAVKLDPSSAEAHSGIAYSLARDVASGWPEPGVDYAALVIAASDRALAINPGNGMAAYAKGLLLVGVGRSSEAKPIVEAALKHNPNLAPLYADLAIIHSQLGDYEQSKSDIEQAMRLSPRDVQLGIWELIYGQADLGLGLYDEAIDEAHRAIDDGFNVYMPHLLLAAAYALSNRDKEARAELAEATGFNPKITSIQSLRPLERLQPSLVDGLRKAGLPEE
jgi:adenylate cyclase